jgi:thiamine-monophosphate kinase
MSGGEAEIIDWFIRKSRLDAQDFPIGIGDDMAQVVLGGGVSILVTTDMLLDGVHFDLRSTTLQQAGYKAMAASLSDCAAMASVPFCAVVSVALPRGFEGRELKQLHQGITRAGRPFGCELIGGDITVWRQPLAVSVSMLSRPVPAGPVKRSGAKPGDCVCVTGSLGGALAGKHLRFKPRVKEAIRIAQTVTINAMIDISDGLSTDLWHICRSSGVGAVLDSVRIPLSRPARKSADPLRAALNDGEDFELLFTLSQRGCDSLLAGWDMAVPITVIGEITDSGKLQIRTAEGRLRRLEPGGYDHLYRRVR